MANKKVRLCITKYSGYANNYDNCMIQEIEGCENCCWYVPEQILRMFQYFEQNGFETYDKEQKRISESLENTEII